MKLQTQIPLSKANNPIDYYSKILMLGSCFSHNMGDKLAYFKFQILQNPFGILFHPLAIENLVQKAVDQFEYTERDIFQLYGRWHCYDAHSELSSGKKEELLIRLNSAVYETNKLIREATHIAITLGTAWVYRHIKRDMFVANCHKVPQGEFQKILLTEKDITTSLISTVNNIKALNPEAQIVFTISPVRHLKDGFVENQRSKSVLISAIHATLQVPPLGARGLYFPSYEIMMDELRDYRFYTADMIHPNEIAIDYIWEKFRNAWISDEVEETMNKVEEIQRSLSHRPFDAESPAHQKFLKTLGQKIAYIKERYPFMNFESTSS
ncbi:GSCFA domain-containing protein [Maribacter algicola]|uniref:GSCFA domain-containing protein n=1 Tax=Maribacter algicola TaxID=2498892 RepID=A0A426RNZ6_9FLAO|nr:GSCFA domain-containing protein [Maribacter algicola]RRQ50681.1 GSCFA domain-containing protein [Maribacter algicola]